ncbi:UbiA prenyltransferase [Heliocybe sulcata]|uniref:UbiA prenyltransferase n=1 Tax=Heliocybe sulcata TaxID=5364 RepID=A0A5C3NI74_9AGAM|nr:UbiA prenyltransferase [Heliocybe sulcata]
MLGFWPCVWGYLFSRRGVPADPVEAAKVIVCLLAITSLVHAINCTWNDICDVDLDRKVERTKERPLASGRISIFAAWLFLLLQTAILLGILSLLNREAFACGLFGVFPLHTLYPLMKRWTYWPQIWLGIATGWGLPTTRLIFSPEDIADRTIWVLIIGNICWSINYDVICATQDREDDTQAGVKSATMILVSHLRLFLSLFATLFVGTLVYAGRATGQGAVYYVVSLAGAAAHLAWQLFTLDPEDRKDLQWKWKANPQIGFLVAAGLLGQMYITYL